MSAVKYLAANCSNHKNKQNRVLCPLLPFQPLPLDLRQSVQTKANVVR